MQNIKKRISKILKKEKKIFVKSLKQHILHIHYLYLDGNEYFAQ